MNERTRLSFLVISLIAALVVSLLAAVGAAFAHDEHAPHFDAPQHGGVVLEFHDEIHYEVVASQEGKQLQVWLSDAHRRPLAASEVADLVVEVGHPGNRVEQVDMHISEDGGSWVGAVYLKDPADIVRIGFTYHMMTATSSTKYDILRHPPAPPAAPHGHDHDHDHDGTHT
jgi:hypothetical protein